MPMHTWCQPHWLTIANLGNIQTHLCGYICYITLHYTLYCITLHTITFHFIPFHTIHTIRLHDITLHTIRTLHTYTPPDMLTCPHRDIDRYILCTHTHKYVHTYMHTSMCTYIIQRGIHACACLHSYIDRHVCIYTLNTSVRMHELW